EIYRLLAFIIGLWLWHFRKSGTKKYACRFFPADLPTPLPGQKVEGCPPLSGSITGYGEGPGILRSPGEHPGPNGKFTESHQRFSKCPGPRCPSSESIPPFQTGAESLAGASIPGSWRCHERLSESRGKSPARHHKTNRILSEELQGSG